jgi:hypothetical protein
VWEQACQQWGGLPDPVRHSETLSSAPQASLVAPLTQKYDLKRGIQSGVAITGTSRKDPQSLWLELRHRRHGPQGKQGAIGA